MNSARAIEMSVYVVRAFVQLRTLLASNSELARRLDELEARIEKKPTGHDQAIAAMLSAIRELMRQRSSTSLRFLLRLCTGFGISASAFVACDSPLLRCGPGGTSNVPAFAQCDATSSRVASFVCAYPAPQAQRGIGFTAGEHGAHSRLTRCQTAPCERRHTDVPAGPQQSRDSDASRAASGSRQALLDHRRRARAGVSSRMRSMVSRMWAAEASGFDA